MATQIIFLTVLVKRGLVKIAKRIALKVGSLEFIRGKMERLSVNMFFRP
jgi:hypothetical protein